MGERVLRTIQACDFDPGTFDAYGACGEHSPQVRGSKLKASMSNLCVLSPKDDENAAPKGKKNKAAPKKPPAKKATTKNDIKAPKKKTSSKGGGKK